MSALDVFDSEQRVESMIVEGNAIIKWATDTYRPVAIVSAYSGGDDSIVTTHFAVNNVPGCLVFNADTGTGLKPTRKHIVDVCGKFGWPLTIGRANAEGPPKKMRQGGKMVPFDPSVVLPAGRWVDGATAYEEFCLNFGFPGRGKKQHSWMYSRLKERPLRRFLRTLRQPRSKQRLLILSGIRHDESAIRMGYKSPYSEGESGAVWVSPFYWRNVRDFEAYREEFGLPRNPVKRTCGISGECCCGTFPNDGERAAYKAADPDFDAYLSSLEARVRDNGFPWGWDGCPPRGWKGGRVVPASDASGESGPQPMCIGCNSGRK
jgi:3'-phosphoadenosine 5'-phosphosulfate sulfotransferase (PAPS reductase)/FAD synthetase